MRPHPIEYNNFLMNYKKILQNIKIDKERNIYESLKNTRCVISEMSTVLFEAINRVPQIFVWRTAKSNFAIKNHPFNTFSNTQILAKKIIHKNNFNKKYLVDMFWKKDWKRNYLNYLNKHIR